MLMRNTTRARGFTLIELLVALAVGSLVVLAISSFFLSSYRSLLSTQRGGQLNRDISTIAQLLQQDGRRAGVTLNSLDTFASNVDLTAGSECVAYPYRTDAQGCTVHLSGFKMSSGRLLMLSRNDAVAGCNATKYDWDTNKANLCNACATPGGSGPACANWSTLIDPARDNMNVSWSITRLNSVDYKQPFLSITMTGTSTKDTQISRTASFIVSSPYVPF
ncbi:prepilin-type N-terminal cleavage/methylation domain-containing protein [Andreprevotia lacus DSM 23236]|jgi:prepilin-type N-terminal cleavage/methylation domain-containing protein|uniref:Prepilin-type N-terminal cleavage/methylation domain-containing protein n=1 Tax=Andreprevotia lacus DSM 23236 TaxID=1121001 RepID=A0A1W1XD51_9NEIS|nr:prepilin-type N-terminal cleavage/methylation domain-containing protein [Andreprevotia lacus]SMC21856.1 prepilin-type N-terminal cleavage/methylation domain-containing protein [Andreprevotia lacus DSM 23236]